MKHILSLLCAALVLSAAAFFQQCSKQKELSEAERLYNEGFEYLTGTNGKYMDKEEGIALIQKAADMGHVDALVELAYSYEYENNGTPRGLAKAFSLYKQAADKGSQLGACLMGRMMWCGEGTAKDEAGAVAIFKKEAKNDCGIAQYYLALSYKYGSGITQSQEQEEYWYKQAFKHLQKANPNKFEMDCLGHCYYDGCGVDQDYEEGVKWLRKAAEQGHVDAQFWLGNCYYFGRDGVDQDFEEAVKWLRKAAEQGHAWAQYDLGRCYYDGEGVTSPEAVKWFRKAAAQGIGDAKIQLMELGAE